MSTELDVYYSGELEYLRKLAGDFARRPENARIASRLGILANGTVADPHVETFIQAVAWLTARIRRKLDDDLPELSESVLDILYPHYLAPLPSMALVKLGLDPSQCELAEPFVVPAGAELETKPVEGLGLRYRTVYPLELRPLEIARAEFSNTARGGRGGRASSERQSNLTLRLATLRRKLPLAAIAPSRLRLHFASGDHNAYELYELMGNRVVAIEIYRGHEVVGTLPLDAVEYVGFGKDEGMVPYRKHSALGYRLLSEYFAFPAKFLFLDLLGLDRALVDLGEDTEVDLVFHFSRTSVGVTAEGHVHLGCTPVVNLFRGPAPGAGVTIDRTRPLQTVVPDPHHPGAVEIYSIDEVEILPEGGRCVPMFSFLHTMDGEEARRYWYARRQERPDGRGSDVELGLTDLDWSPSHGKATKILVQTTCFNGDLPRLLRSDPGFGGLTIDGQGASTLVSRVETLVAPTPTRRPAGRKGRLWRLVSHIALNHTSLLQEDGDPMPLRELLELYVRGDETEARTRVESVLEVQARRGTARVQEPHRRSEVTRGVEVEITFKRTFPDAYRDDGLFLFTAVLERFLGLYCPVNAFSRLTARVEGMEEILRRWPARAGYRTLL